MGDKAVISFLGCCVQLLQILMEVTGVLVKNQSPLSFINDYVSNEVPVKSMEKPTVSLPLLTTPRLSV